MNSFGGAEHLWMIYAFIVYCWDDVKSDYVESQMNFEAKEISLSLAEKLYPGFHYEVENVKLTEQDQTMAPKETNYYVFHYWFITTDQVVID